SRFVSVYDTRNLEPGQYTLGLYGTFAENPVDLSFDSSGDRSAQLVRNTIGADLIGAIGVTDWFELGVDVPAMHNYTKELVSLAGTTETEAYFLAAVSLEGKFTPVNGPPGKGFGFSFLQRWIRPTGDDKRSAGPGRAGG